MLTDEQRAELEAIGPENVRLRILQLGISAHLGGFRSGTLMRADIDDWLAGQSAKEAADRKSTLRWAKVAGWTGIAGVLVGLVTIAVTIWLTQPKIGDRNVGEA